MLTKPCRSCGHTFPYRTSERDCPVCKGGPPPTNPLEARTVAVENLMALARVADDETRLRAAEMLLEHTCDLDPDD